jgi:8-oxo-dGTP pyrophosphatase MutT (NUDIX family)
MVWEASLEDALETAAGWLADNAPGLIMSPDDPELDVLYREACEELGEDPDSGEGPGDAWEQATADLTYTESGYLTSYEWGIVFDEGASRSDVKAWLADLAERHYSDTPLVSVG